MIIKFDALGTTKYLQFNSFNCGIQENITQIEILWQPVEYYHSYSQMIKVHLDFKI